MNYMFDEYDSLKSIDISKWKINDELDSFYFFDNKDINGK